MIQRDSSHFPLGSGSPMAPLPSHRPDNLSLGPLEAEILMLIWARGSATVRDLHDHIQSDLNRDLTQSSVHTVLKRLTQKGWLRREATPVSATNRRRRSYRWYPTLSQHDATLLKAHQQLHSFLAIGNPDIVAAFADSLGSAEVDQIEAIVARIRMVRQDREDRNAH